MTNFIQLQLTCANTAEADKIAVSLLEKRLIVCAKQLPVSSKFWWDGKVESSDEILLAMDTREDLFDDVETEIKKLHSYETFVLHALKVDRVSTGVNDWMKDNLKN